MTELFTAAQMRAIEQAAIDSGEVTGLQLMERAGRGVVEAVFEEWPELAKTSHRAVVLCGPGNNGGDGFVVARLLKEWGWEVEVFLYGDPEKLPPDARVNYERWCELGKVLPWDDNAIRTQYENDEVSQFLVVDALFGTGLTRRMPEDTDEMWRGFMPSALGHNAHVTGADRFVAIDIASGICSDSGRDFGALPTHLTVTFHRAKIGHFLSERCGNYGGVIGSQKVVVKDIGLGPQWAKGSVKKVGEPDGRISKAQLAHKYTHGHALILSGGPGKGGAARLTARGALRIGAGVVTLGCPPAALQENATQLNAIMLRSIKGAEGLAKALEDPRLNALCLGPGLGLAEERLRLVETALKSARATVLDADALTLISRDPALFAALHPACVLTPHAGEFARLFPDISARLDEVPTKGPAYSKADATREAAARAGCTVLFKGPDTVIADPSGRCSINSAHYDRAAPWLATAGSGDVLTGFITGLLARGFAPMQAAETGAWLHVECALKFGPGLIAEDLPEMLPQVFRDLGL